MKPTRCDTPPKSVIIAIVILAAYISCTELFLYKLRKSSFGSNVQLWDIYGDWDEESGDTITSVEKPLNLSLLWLAPFKSGTGYGVEATGFVQSIERDISNLSIFQWGEYENPHYMKVLDEDTRQLLNHLWSLPEQVEPLVNYLQQALHDPANWSLAGIPRDSEQLLTLPESFDDTWKENWQMNGQFDILVAHIHPLGWIEPLTWMAKYRIGRTMFETDRVPDGWVDRFYSTMNELWVPSKFSRQQFIAAGVDPSQIHVIPQPIEQSLFSICNASYSDPLPPTYFRSSFRGCKKDDFIFLSVFKWEPRKGVEYLLDAYFHEFTSNDNVCLVLLTGLRDQLVQSNISMLEQIVENIGKSISSSFPRYWFIPDTVAPSEMGYLYLSADAFVLPSRGEGWGRPLMEAMACGLPVIGTNWSAPTTFMNEDNAFPIPVERWERIYPGEGSSESFWGHYWAVPSVKSLQSLMHIVVSQPTLARQKARRGQEQVLQKYQPAHIRQLVLRRLIQIIMTTKYFDY
eukprot:jgi/Galph1/4780/GphlegSOOS_G3414.1